MSPTGGAGMNHFERLLQDELNRLVDRIAVRAGDGHRRRPEVRSAGTRIERSEERLTVLRAALLEGYAEWTRAIDECEDLWALAGLRAKRRSGTAAPRRQGRRSGARRAAGASPGLAASASRSSASSRW